MANHWRMIISGSGDQDLAKSLALAEQLKGDGQTVTSASITINGDDHAIVVGSDGSLSLPKSPEEG